MTPYYADEHVCIQTDYCNAARGHVGECANHPTEEEWVLACPDAFTPVEIQAAAERVKARGWS
jgi:hypothetical protein